MQCKPKTRITLLTYFISDLDNVLKKDYEIDGQKLEISDKQFKFKPVPKKRTKKPATEAQEVV